MSKIGDNLCTWGMAFILAVSVAWSQDLVPEAPPDPEAPAAVELPARAASAQRRLQAAAATNGRNAPSGTKRLPGSLQADAGMAPGTTTLTPTVKEAGAKTTTPALKFEDSTSDFLLRAYAEETGLTLLVAPDVPKVANINLRSQEGVPLTKEEYLEAIEVTLSMNGIVLEPYGEKFLKVLPRKTIRTEGIRILMDAPEGGHPEKTQIISQMIQLKSITISEAQKALEGFKRPDGMIQAFERTNSLLVTDTQENVNRMLEIVQFIDQPLVATEEVNVRTIRYAKADDIKKRLEEIVAESQKQSQAKEEIKPNVAGAPGFTRTTSTGRPLPPGLTRLGSRATPATPTPAAPEPNVSIETLVSDADRGMIRGKVQIIADERSNQLIIITREENMNFFDKIITVLDIETAPDVMVEVQRLEYADSEEVSSMLNDLIGNASSKKDDSAPAGTAKPAAGESGSTSLAAAVAARTTSRTASGDVSESGKSKLGQLSKDNIKILADKRTNAIVMMGSPNDIKAIKEIIAGMDIRLSQVLIETVVIQIGLDDSLQTGVDWILGKQKNNYLIGGKDVPAHETYSSDIDQHNNAITITNLIPASFTGDLFGGGGGSTSLGSLINSTNSPLESAASMISPGVNYFLKSERLNISAMIKAAKSDSHAKVLSSPILMTVDNKEATLEATSMRYLYKGVRYSGSTQYGTEVPDYEQRDIGLTVKITPRINPNGSVILSIDETFETIGAPQTVGKDEYPTINTRKVQADIAVENMQTVVLGGLVQSEMTMSESGIPLLKDIPFIGKYLFSSTSSSENRSELIVFITPYVLDSKEDLEAEARRRKSVLNDARPWDDGGWSKSSIADPPSKKTLLEREKRQWRAEDEERDAIKALEEAQRKRDVTLRERDKEDAARALKQAKRDTEEARRRAEEDGEDSTEAQLRVLLNKLQEKQREQSQTADVEKPVIEPNIQISESIEVLGPKADREMQKPQENVERLLSPDTIFAPAGNKPTGDAGIKQP